MAIVQTSFPDAKVIEIYGRNRVQRVPDSSRPGDLSRQDRRNRKDAATFSQEALDKLKLLKEQERAGSEKESRATFERDRDLKESLAVLGVESGASVEEIKKAYAHTIVQYHPDKYASSPPEFRLLAEAKTRQINEAYDNLTKRR